MRHRTSLSTLTIGTLFTLFGATLAAPAPTVAQDLEYPKTRKVDVVDDYHGVEVRDPYRWLEDTNSEETAAWVEAQNEVTFAYLERIPEREHLRERLTELWNYERYRAPFKEADTYFFLKNDGLQDQPVLYKVSSLEDEPQVLLDPNELSEDGTVALGGFGFSEDASLMAYATSTSGSDWREVYVRDVKSGEDLDDHLEWVKFSGLSWTHDGEGFLYSRYPAPDSGDTYEGVNEDQKVYYHRAGTPQSEDVVFYEQPEHPQRGLNAFVTEDGRYALIYVSEGTDERDRVYYRDLVDPESPRLDAPVVKLLDEFDASYGFVGNDETTFYFRTDLDAPRYRLIAIDIENPARESWRTIIPESDDVLQGVEIVNGQFVAEYMRDAHSRLVTHSKEGEVLGEIDLPGLGSVGAIRGERDGSEMFYSFQSFLYPTTIFRYDFETGTTSIFRAPDVDFDPDGYVTKQIFYRSKDGTRIPMFITHREGIPMDGSNPTYLYGYGGFNISLTPRFSTGILAWLELGGVYAQPNLRGGGEYGESWHEQGMLDQKQNVFDDFIAAAEYLIDEGYTSTPKLAIGGGSNGGLLVGAAMTQRPHLFGAALPAVGVMDMLRFHEFTIGWAWVSDYGSSEDPEMFFHLYSYSPYHNLHPDFYPATMVTTADHDDRVVPGHSFKFAARLQEMQMGDAPVVIRIQTKAGHGAGKPTDMIIQEQADRWAFLVENLDVHVETDATEE